MGNDQNEIERRKMTAICNLFGVNIADVERRLGGLGEDGVLISRGDDDGEGCKFRGVKYYSIPGLHLNRFYYAMASLVLKNVKNILEIGTGDALSTVSFSRLFPNASIFTIDLPQDDPMHNRWRKESMPGTKRGKRRQERLNRKNITYFEKNTFFLPMLGLVNEFELILVDGDHNFPQVAGDIMFAYNRMRGGGFLFFHDYYDSAYKDRATCAVGEVVDWMAKRIPERLFIFPMGTPPGTPWEKMALIVKGCC